MLFFKVSNEGARKDSLGSCYSVDLCNEAHLHVAQVVGEDFIDDAEEGNEH